MISNAALKTCFARLLRCSLAVLVAAAAHAADDGRSVVVLINDASPHSRSVGAHYATRRAVPQENICRIRCSTSEVISRPEFDRAIRMPLRTFLLQRRLAQQQSPGGDLRLNVKYLVSTYGVPVKIRETYSDDRLRQRLQAEQQGRHSPRHPGNAASVDSELCLLAQARHRLDGWVPNPLYRKPAAAGSLLFATRLDGPTPDIAKGLVDAAIQAEKRGLVGIGYVDARGLAAGPYKTGDDWMLAAASHLKAAGLFTRLDLARETFDPQMPMPHAAFYFGWYRKDFAGPMAAPSFRFPTGAVAYHLHSGSAARLRKTSVGWAGPLLAKGAAATMGSVFEPLLGGTTDLGEFARLFLAGASFGESAVRATARLSWMMTFVGDPLYAPFRPDRRTRALARNENRRWRRLHRAVTAWKEGDFDNALAICAENRADPLCVELAARITYFSGRKSQSMAIYRTLAAMAPDDFSAVKAHRVIGDWLAASGRPAPAMAAYLECIAAHPRSPHTLPIYRLALRLARRLKDARQQTVLWKGLAAYFPHRALGRFAAGELWTGDRRPDCPLPTCTVPTLQAAPKVDGRAEKAEWQGAAHIAQLASRAGPAARRHTTVRLCRDDAALYVLARMVSNGGGSTAFGALAGDETFLITLSPHRDLDRTICLTVRRKDVSVVPVRGATWRAAPSYVLDGKEKIEVGWLVELRIPFDGLGLRKPPGSTLWAANFAERCSVPRFPFKLVPCTASWAQMDADAAPDAPECAGYLVFK